MRFASVYKRFKTLEELVDEAKAVIDAKRFEDPTQGRLFLAGNGDAQAGGGRRGGAVANGVVEQGRGRKRKTAVQNEAGASTE